MGENRSDMADSETESGAVAAEGLKELKLLVPDELHRAWQRCSWVLLSETGRSRTAIMSEMVHDFLVKHGC